MSQELKFCKIALFLCVSFSGERIERKFKTEKSSLAEFEKENPGKFFWKMSLFKANLFIRSSNALTTRVLSLFSVKAPKKESEKIIT